MSADASGSRPAFAPDLALERLFQAVLCDGAAASAAFAAWTRAIRFDDIPSSHFRLMGELAGVVDRLAPGYENRNRLLGMKKYVWSNNVHILRMALPVVDALLAERVPFAVLKGGGVIAADPAALHSRFIRDLDLMVAEPDVPRAAEILLRGGWRPITGRIPGRIRAQPFDKRIVGNPHGQDRAEIDLHRSALHFGRYGRFDDAFFDRTLYGNLLGRTVRYLHPGDQALVAVMHALNHDPDSSFGWLGDAVRALRHPDFQWGDFTGELMRRRLGRHAAPVLGYLDATFGVGVPDGLLDAMARTPLGWLFDAEVAAIGRNRLDRGWRGRAAMMAAEAIRSGAVSRFVRYRTDYGIRMRRFRSRPAPPDLPAGGFRDRVEVLGGAPSRAAIEVVCGPNGSRKFDLDLWAGDRWIARLKLRAAFAPAQSIAGCWRAVVEMPPGVAPAALRIAPAGLPKSAE